MKTVTVTGEDGEVWNAETAMLRSISAPPATIVSMIASFVVSLTAIPVLCSLVLKVRAKQEDHADGRLVRALKGLLKSTLLRLSLRQPVPETRFGVFRM